MKLILQWPLKDHKNNVKIARFFMLCIILSIRSLQVVCRVPPLTLMKTTHSKALETIDSCRKRSMKTGIIGGLGPDTTVEFYKKIISTYQKKSCNERPSILIASVSIPYAVEQNFILKNQGVDHYKPFLADAAMSLEKAGADFLVMPCNSLHVLIDDIRKAVKISVVSIIDETVQFLKNNNFSKVALISTLATIKNRLYEKAFDSNDIVYLKPKQEEQIQIGSIISNLVQGKIVEEDCTKLEKIIHNFEGQVDCVVLACTDLQLLQPKHPNLKILDTMHILADAVVTKLKKEEHQV